MIYNSMGELSIKVTIANRVYPLTIDAAEEESVRKASKLIDEKIRFFEKNYSVRDSQDLLAMCALQFANEALEFHSKNLVEDNGFLDKLQEIDKLVADTLNSK